MANDPNVTVTSVTNPSNTSAVINLRAINPGAAGNSIAIGTTYTYNSSNFSSPSFTASAATNPMTGGSNGSAGTTVYDAGTVSVTVGSFTANVSYGQPGNNSSMTVASALAAALSSASSPVSTTSSGSSVNIQYKTVGTAGNVAVSCTSSTTQTAYFSSPSFTCNGISLAGGLNSEGPSLDHNYFVTQYAYDALGNLIKVTQKGDAATTPSSQWRVRNFSYDSLSRLLSSSNPESGTITYLYDSDGNMLQKTSPAPNQTSTATQTISYCYDSLKRVLGKGYGAQSCPLTAPAVTYAYDSGTNATGRLTSLVDQAGTDAYSYDALGRATTETRVISGVSKSMGYSYNLDNSIASLTYPSNAVLTYTPWQSGSGAVAAPSAVSDNTGINYVTGAFYNAPGQVVSFTNGQSASFPGISNNFSYNKRLQPVTISASTATQTVFSIGYDFHVGDGTTGSDNGNVWNIYNYRDHSRDQAFSYDALNRLTSAQNAGTDCTANTLNGKTEYWGNNYSYDAWGNLISKVITKCRAENLTVTPLSNNQLSGYGYDAAGNMISDPTEGLSFSYDPENRITGAAGYTYTYDANGNRVSKSNGTSGTLYWNMLPGIVAESDLNGVLKSEYVFFNGQRVARRDSATGSVEYYFSDSLKTAAVITDSSGNIKSESDYYPWGGELQYTNSDANHYKFTGKERDSESNLDYFGARYYSSGLSRFLRADWAASPAAIPYAELADPQSLNLYSYVRNRPTVMVDPDGHYLLGAISEQNEAEYEGRIYGSEKNQNKQSDQQNQKNTENGAKQPGFWGKMGQRLSNFFHHKGFHTDEELAPKGSVDVVVEAWSLVDEKPDAVAGVTDAAGLVFTVTDQKKLGYLNTGISLFNDHGPQNIIFTTIPIVAKGADVPVGIFSLELDIFNLEAQTVMNGMFQAMPPDNIPDGNGHLVPNPAFNEQNICQDLGCEH
jgi:RHS repeat-associated protein